ncbi:D,D-heptose 1,7-bisphosphate phosphatase [Sulfurihydrogenibium azorense Az-Fu1]|uniref:D,D-heptose 1,7-bisphosphate phosphatase n=1 Tax=Sulfurihydrogenibium azorense (strain DSM 15241 / OCM 825 / Az-Fu1) TaxID=204536 RepID=C1DX36_SULAA|nr:D-glycero-beta-D-manno-heptose 1,7-bisphosphate 7-phosphatase [Sulfurihydrogenibium azorense]ACN99287.1 D,D-heptose 1,7-bisphosphate phosphatase [Sulfurihydrogenibium azorense Az-Fu1]
MKAVFLDRDGVINVDKGYVHKIEDFEFYPNVFEALKKLQDNGFKLFIVTNQSGIAVGYYTEEDFLKLTDYMLKEFEKHGIKIEKVYYCPHHENGTVEKYSIKCDCRKPESGMIRQAIKEFSVDPSKSFLIGDKENDILAAHKEGIKAALVKTGQGLKYIENTTADFIGEDILDVVENFILKH